MPHELTEHEKKSSFWNVVFSYSTQQRWTISQSDSDVRQKGGFYTITNDDQLSSWTKKFQSMFQSQTCTKRGYGLYLVVRCQSDPLQLSESQGKPLQLRSMFGKLMRCTKNCNACSWHWSTERAQFFSMTIPDPTLHNQHFKSWTNWPRNCCLIFHICLVFC